MQHEILTRHDLLKPDGTLVEAGWSRAPRLRYNPENIRFPKELFKEWHYYFAGDDHYGLGFSMANMGAFHRLSVSFMDYRENRQVNEMAFCPAESSVLSPPRTSWEDVRFQNERAVGEYRYSGRQMALNVRFEDFSGADPLEAELALEFPEGDICEHAFPFAEEPGLFFYCHKVPCIRVSGGFRLGGLSYRYDPSRAFAVQDWGRGVWPEHSTPCWGSAGGVVGGRLFGFNIGSRYGDTSAATENVLFYGGRAHKLEEVDFVIQDDETAFSKPWAFRSSDGRFEMTMDPVLDRHSSAPAGIRYGAEQHQVFGYYSGTAVLDDGTPLKIDRLFGFAEKVVNDWPFSGGKREAAG
ncbi:DUF2804 domain-containing protein [Anaerotruncus sp. DFI.9.16]|uniref:DUF2804 domain-containing protein n=1 Tax=Anaerotruncus sp. DFI.9.16 TaxID=2965275 RepID=UPI00210AAF63|nr:DUF2804 domain-containing protein [Anaerotruncus sp. DFI.9.16]MCQ4896529.1 DUF2804 domain-containing protein [Anaerotruncus sp. DFI.9.16]